MNDTQILRLSEPSIPHHSSVDLKVVNSVFEDTKLVFEEATKGFSETIVQPSGDQQKQLKFRKFPTPDECKGNETLILEAMKKIRDFLEFCEFEIRTATFKNIELTLIITMMKMMMGNLATLEKIKQENAEIISIASKSNEILILCIKIESQPSSKIDSLDIKEVNPLDIEEGSVFINALSKKISLHNALKEAFGINNNHELYNSLEEVD